MDSLTQIVLGASVGEAVLGRKVGNKAVLWGAISGTIPDLDVFIGPFLNDIERLVYHRGFSHSLFFCLLFAPILSYWIIKIYGEEKASWADWTKLTFLALITHPILDMFTGFGTQFFQPISNVRVSFNTIGIIDLFYTLPFLFCLILTLFLTRGSTFRKWVNYIGLSLSTIYLLATTISKCIVHKRFNEALTNQNIAYHRVMTSSFVATNFLWHGVAETEAGYYIGQYSHFDRSDIKFNFYSKNNHLIPHLKNEDNFYILKWVSNNYFRIEEIDNRYLKYHDVRFPVLEDGQNFFTFKLSREGFPKEIIRSPRMIPTDSTKSAFENLSSYFTRYRQNLVERIKGR